MPGTIGRPPDMDVSVSAAATGAKPAISRNAARALATQLRSRIEGDVRFDDGSRALYATDASIYRQVPIGVVMPRRVEDVLETLRACRAHDAPVLPRGAGTSLAGQCCNTAVVIDFSRYMNRLLDIDVSGRRAMVEPGCVLDHLRDAAELSHLTFGPDPSTHAHNTLGGMIGNDSCGVHSIMAGRTADNVRALDVVTWDGAQMRVGPTPEDKLDAIISAGGRRGKIHAGLKSLRGRYADLIRARYPKIPRRVSGYNLDNLLPENGFDVARALVGSEGTCVVIVGAEVDLVPSPPGRALLVIGYEDVYRAGDDVPLVRSLGPIGLEGIDGELVDDMRRKHMHPADLELLPEGSGWLLAEFGGEDDRAAAASARKAMQAIRRDGNARDMKLFEERARQKRLWKVRESGLGATAHVPGKREAHPGWEDAAVPPEKVGAYLRDFRALLDRYGYDCALYGHFGDGCIHCRIDYDLSTAKAVDHWHAFMHDAADLVVSYGGSLSGEHGDGQVRAELLPKMFGPELVRAFGEFKALWDPAARMNPGKVVDPLPMTAALREGPDYRPPKLATHFAWPDDHASFARAVDRCVGVGNCRNPRGGVMCPSWRATEDEQHSTRGRSRLLFEMLKGDPLEGGWRNRAVREALDLCLACKGCKHDCPVNVDMATYKAEFMSHYYRGRLRPRSAYSMGLIFWWARLASGMPGLANAALKTPALKWIGGIARERDMPRFANPTFKRWFSRRAGAAAPGEDVVLWPDTFNNYLHPKPLADALAVLEAAGRHVTVPSAPLCCARPLYAEGMLDLARRQLRSCIDALAPHIERGTPLVGLEPSCVAAFRDELPQLFPDDERAQWLARNTFLLSEFLDRIDFEPPRIDRKALVHLHCHHHALLDTDAEKRLLRRAGLDFEVLDEGCCGMAGSFGFQSEHFELSRRIGEIGPIPSIRQADARALIVTNGFSCRQQIAQFAGRRAVDVAEVLAMGLGPREAERREAPASAAAHADENA
jgi:FAD/FMN-containing dehydrogenase/Fe-S oxidoreductase